MPLRQIRWRRFPWLLFALMFAACATDDCACDGFEFRDFPEDKLDNTLPNGAQARLTSHGIKYMESQVGYIIDQVLEDGLSFCIPEDQSVNPALCVESTCRNGVAGCQVDLTLDEARLDPSPPLRVDASVVVGSIDERLNFDYDTGIGTARCYAQLFRSGSSTDTPAQVPASVPVNLSVDVLSPTRDLRARVGTIDVDLDGVDFILRGRGGFSTVTCAGASLVRGLFRNRIRNELIDVLQNTFEQIASNATCVTCANPGDRCPAQSTCTTRGVCMRSQTNECVPTAVGVEGRLDLTAFIPSLPNRPRMDVMAKAADFVRVDTGVSAGMRSGFEPVDISPCQPVDPTQRPTFANIPESTALHLNAKPNGDEFMFGVGVHRRALEHLLWTTWATGVSCLNITTEDVELLSTQTFEAILPSLRDIVDGDRNATMQLVPQTFPRVTLGRNEVRPSGDGWEIVDPLLTVEWEKLDFHVFGYAQDRYLRLFSLRGDLILPVALAPDGSGGIEIVLEDLTGALQNIEARGMQLLREGPDRILNLVPILLGVASPLLSQALGQVIPVPDFFGFRLVINQEDITSVDDGQFLAIFANLARAQAAFVERITPHVVSHSLALTPPDGEDFAHGRLEVNLLSLGDYSMASADVEYSYRINGGFWSMYQRGPKLIMEDPLLGVQGSHLIEFRSRLRGLPETTSLAYATLDLVVDWEPPRLELSKEGHLIRLKGWDAVTKDLVYAWQIDGVQDWTAFSRENLVDLDQFADLPQKFIFRAMAQDEAGMVVEVAERFQYQSRPLKAPEPVASKGGCAQAGGGDPPYALFVLLGLLLFFSARRRSGKEGLLVMAVLLLSGCGGCSGEMSATTGECFGDFCKSNQACVLDGDCATACPDGYNGICELDRCRCVNLCIGGCQPDEFCCLATDSCVSTVVDCSGEVSCEAGFENAVVRATPNRQTCELTDYECDCVALPPIPIGWHGQNGGIDASGDLVAVSAYNRTYRDLMVGFVDEEFQIEWYFVDGVPSEGTIEGDPGSYRGGITARGEEVGRYSALAVGPQGHVHVLYYAQDAEELRLAHGRPVEDGWDFTTRVADASGDTGYWPAMTVIDQTIHAVWGFADDAGKTGLRYGSYPAAQPDAVLTWEVTLLDEADVPAEPGRELPRMLGLYNDLSGNSAGDLLALQYNGIAGRIVRVRKSEGEWRTPQPMGLGSGPWASAALDEEGLEHVAFQVAQGLRYSRFGGEFDSSLVHDGIRDNGEDYFMGRIGENVSLRYNGPGDIRMTFQDAWGHRLYTARRMGENWHVQKVEAAETEAAGFFGGQTRRTNRRVLVEFVVDRSATPQGFLRAMPAP